MTIHNGTQYPNDEVRKLVRLALAELDTSDLHVHLTSGGWGGRGGIRNRHFVAEARRATTATYLIHVRVPTTDEHYGMPGTYHNGRRGKWVPIEEGGKDLKWVPVKSGTVENPGRWPVITLHDWREYIVGMTAHEGAHVEQVREHKRISEIRAEWFEFHTLARYRASLPKPLGFATVQEVAV